MMDFYTINLSSTSCYLIKAGDGYLLVDCGTPEDSGVLDSAMRRIGADYGQIKYLFLTHHHSDHCGLMNYIKGKNHKMKVIMSIKCAEMLRTGTRHKPAREVYANSGLRSFMGAYGKLSNKLSDDFPPYLVEDGDILIDEDCGFEEIGLGVGMKILMTPGHTLDSISLISGEEAFIGDAARNILNFTGAKYLPIIYSSFDDCHLSWKKLYEAGARNLYPAHGKSFDIGELTQRL